MSPLSLSHYLVLGAVLFAISVVGIFLNRRNIIVFSHFLGDIAGQVFVFFILTVAAAESAIGLAIVVVLFRNLNTIDVEDLDSLKG
jgi:NADH-quinone oxidoreductase subunit K